jgi:hypothetical protein
LLNPVAKQIAKYRALERAKRTSSSIKQIFQALHLIQNRRDAPLLLQWGERDFNAKQGGWRYARQIGACAKARGFIYIGLPKQKMLEIPDIKLLAGPDWKNVSAAAAFAIRNADLG